MSTSSEATPALRQSGSAPSGGAPGPRGSGGGSAASGGVTRTGGAPARKPGQPLAAGQPRKVRLTVARVDPWSTMKLSFLLSVALGIATVVAVMVLWLALGAMGVFESVNHVLGQLTGEDGKAQIDILDFIGFPKVVSLSIVVAVVDVVLFTAVATLAAFLYNVSASLVGGLQLTLTDD